jgi:hypothetical protein
MLAHVTRNDQVATTLVQERLDGALLYALLILEMMVCGASTLGCPPSSPLQTAGPLLRF